MTSKILPTIAIVGRPNVGKSTLFNRLTHSRLAIVDDTPGVTRDWREAPAHLAHLEFMLRDTAGIEERAQNSLAERLYKQTEQALAGTKVILFTIDAREGVTPVDRELGRKLRKMGIPIILLANKAETKLAQAGLDEALKLGFGEPLAISAAHGEGMTDLMDALRPYVEIPGSPLAGELPTERRLRGVKGKQSDYYPPQSRFAQQLPRKGGAGSDPLPEDEEEPEIPEAKKRPLKICVIGRPNVGKSTLVNALIGEDRLLTGPEAGLTRESIAIQKLWNGREVELVDTAGLRKKARIEEKLEKLSVASTLNTLRYAELALVVIDVNQPFEKQDLQLVDLVVQEGRAIVIVVNKWDLVKNGPAKRKELMEQFTRLLPQIKGAPLVTISATQEEGLDYLFKAIVEMDRAWNKRISTAKLNNWLRDKLMHNPPPAVSGRRLKIKYMTQAKSRPPTFVAFTTRADEFPESYIRFLVNDLRVVFDMPGVPIRLQLREGKNPYEGKKKVWE